jgi:membrane fusion protein, copper/silver efflux system
MNGKLQVLLAVALIGGAVGVVKFVDGDESVAEEGMAGGHNASDAPDLREAQPVRVSAETAGRIGMTLATVEFRTLDTELRSVGWVSFDETRLYSVSPKIGGWIEHLWVEFTGAPVEEGQPLLEIYSPELVAAQEELILARRLMDQLQATSGRAKRDAEELLFASRRRLDYWDIPADAIEEIEASGEVRKTMVLRAPESGLVVEKHVLEGDRIQAGTTLFRIADLSHVWVEAEIFERDLGKVSLGQIVDLSLEAFPGRVFNGKVTYVYPTVAMGSRTGRIRIDLSNDRLDLKPGMYADVRIALPNPGSVLTVPKSAVLTTGERSVIFHYRPDGLLHPIDIQVGRRNGEFVEVISGLSEGDRVVSSANFLIDSESNLGAAMAAMAGMDMGGPDKGRSDMEGMNMDGEDLAAPEMDGMDMPEAEMKEMGEASADTTMSMTPAQHDLAGNQSGGN